eukprot:2418912-Rhodomonas_salina.1
MRRAVRLTEYHNESLNSAWCRHFGAGPVLSLPLRFPSTQDYETVSICCIGIDNIVARLNEHAFLKSFLVFLTDGDPFPHKLTARVDKWWRGPDNAAQCEHNVLAANGASALLGVSWCEQFRKLLRAEIDFTIPEATIPMGFTFHTPAYSIPLHSDATALFLDLCRIRGLSQRDAERRLLRALQTQLAGLISVNIQTTDGAPPRNGQAA